MFAAMILPSWSQTEVRAGTVSFLVVDESGGVLSGWKVTSFKSNTNEVASQFTGLIGKRIPVGFYQYVLTGVTVSRLGSPWTPSLRGRVEVFRPEEFVVKTATNAFLAGFAADSWPPPFSFVIQGKIDPMPARTESSDPVRINIHSPVPPWSDVDVLVDPNGEFRIFRAFDGLWVLTVMQGKEILHVEPVFFAQKRRPVSFVLRIGDKPRPVLRVD